MAILLGVIALVCVRLGVWQVDRLHRRRAVNAESARARREPPMVLEASRLPDSAALAGRRLSARGHYDFDHEVVLRGEAHDGVPGVHVVTPLLLEGDRVALLVDRGFLPSPDAATVRIDSLRELGRVEARGVAEPFQDARQSGQEIARGGNSTWRRLNLAELRGRLPYALLPVYLLQSPDSTLPVLPRRLDAPPLDDGPHLNYAIQWFVFAAMALVFAGIVLWQRRDG